MPFKDNGKCIPSDKAIVGSFLKNKSMILLISLVNKSYFCFFSETNIGELYPNTVTTSTIYFSVHCGNI